ncbi:MAG: HD domain-containing protein [Parcubacteria group bacterium]|jgi:hypothetical protein
MKLQKRLEEKLKKEVLAILENGKENWDIPHTLDSVKWMRKLILGEGGNEKILVPAMYFHDIGYPHASDGYGFRKAMAMKKKHAERGAKIAKKVLERIGGFSKEEIEKIAYLVRMHDKHENIESHERQLVFEADGLAQINWHESPPNFGKEDCLKFLDKYFRKERPPERWRTKTGKRHVRGLMKKSLKYWE